jgi:class 3 adenylate cyclase
MHREVRKTVSVVFSDVAGSTALAEQLDPEALRRTMTRYFEVARGIHERHGGVVEKFIGDAVMAVFGVPHTHEDDALRAVRAASELHEAMAELNRELARGLEVTLRIRTGVNTGLVLAVDERQGHAFVGGDTVNVAARLQSAAEAGAVLLGEATYRLVADAVRVRPIAAFLPSGKTTPIPVYHLLGVEAGAAGRVRRLDTPLVGRAPELAALGQRLDRAAAGLSCQLVTVLGDAGVGKSRLLQAFADRAGQQAVVLHARCPAYGEATGAVVVGQLLAQAAEAAVGGCPAAASRRLADLVAAANAAWSVGDPARTSGITSDPRPVFRALRLLLEALAAERPLVLILDDLHWAEPVLLDLVEYLHAFASDASLLLVVAARRQLLERRPGWTAGATLVLEPLTAAEAAELAANLGGPAGPDTGTRERIAAWSEGNPLFVEEQLRWLADRDPPSRDAGDRAAELPVPPAVEALAGAELDHLPSGERALLEFASVVGRVFDWAAVAALAPAELRPRVGALLLSLTRRNLIRVVDREFGDEAFAFRHLVLRDAAYQAIPKRQRAVLHARAAERIAETAGERAVEENAAVRHHLELAYRYLAQLSGDELPPRVAADLSSSYPPTRVPA